MLDTLIIAVDKAVGTLFLPAHSKRKHPDAEIVCITMTGDEARHSLSLMRVNHCGEVCAQALYQGQALTVRDKSYQQAFIKAADEETEHLAWTETRIRELGGSPSILNPLFYAGSLMLGLIAGSLGDKWSLGFLEETECQVEQHLKEHQEQLPANDTKSLAILQQMQIDEAQHAQMAHAAGASKLPAIVKYGMQLLSRVMKSTTSYI